MVVSCQLPSRCLIRSHLWKSAIVRLGRGVRGVHFVQIPWRQMVGMQLRLVACLLERVALELRLRVGSAPPAPLVYEHPDREEADCGDPSDDWPDNPGFVSLGTRVLCEDHISQSKTVDVSLGSYSPVDGVLLEEEVCDGPLLEVGDEAGRGSRLTGVARSWLICSWSVCICEEYVTGTAAENQEGTEVASKAA